MRSRFVFVLAIIGLLFGVVGPAGGQDATTSAASTARVDGLDATGIDVTPSARAAALSKKLLTEAEGPEIYLIRLAEQPLATYEGGVAGLGGTARAATGERKLDAGSDRSVAYVDWLRSRQDSALADMEAELGRSLEMVHRYVAANNGFSLRLTPQEAAEIAKMRGVVHVQRDVERELQTDNGPAWIEAPALWDTSGLTSDCVDNCGEGVIVGVIDTGINPLNPSFADIGGDGYDHTNPAGKFFGVCDPANTSPPPDSSPYDGGVFPCNDKLIGAWGYGSVNGFDPTDYDGHGSHTASTAAGNKVSITVTGNDGDAAGGPKMLSRDISGVAPHANIIAYGSCCTLSALTASIDQTIIDGVDVINYSIGSPAASALWSDFDTVGFLAARDAGIFVATSAGNEGPGPDTVGSPADAPWLTSVGASTHDRALPNTLGSMTGGDTPPPADIAGKGFTVGYGPAPIVYAGDFGDALCLSPFPAGTWTSGEIVVCDRGVIARVAKGQNVKDGGAGGFVLANDIGNGDSLNGDPHFLPGVHIGFDDGDVLKTWLASGTGQMATISGAVLDIDAANGDIMAAFSSRGANRAIDTIAPHVTAPGVDIIAAEGFGGAVEWNFLSGTSMASPHVAGAGALMINEHPTWTPAQIQSALMTTGYTGVLKEDGVTPADPFDMGSGRVDLASGAVDAGLVFDETTAAYLAADPDAGGDPKTLNLPSMANSQCLGVCSFTRTAQNVTGGSETWTATTSGVPAITVTPSNFTLADGATQDIDFDVDVAGLPFGDWVFGEVVLTPDGAGPPIKLPVAVIPSAGIFPEHVDVWTRRDAGSMVLEDLTAIEITDLTIEVSGLAQGNREELSLSQDPTNGDPYDNLDDGTTQSFVLSVPAGTSRLVAQTFDSEAPDIDLFVGTGSVPSAATQVCSSTTATADEYCDVMDPAAGDWWILVQNWAESGDPPDAVSLDWAVVAGDAGNMTVMGPAAVPAGTPFDLTLAWNEPALEAGDFWYGSFTMGSSAGSPGDIGKVTVDLERHPDDVSKMALPGSGVPGDTVTYEVTIQPNITHVDQDYLITDVIPDGMTYVDGSATNGATHAGGVITWAGTVAVPEPTYEMSTPATNPACDPGFGIGYLDLESFGIFPNPGIVGDTTTFTLSLGGDPFDFYGTGYADIGIADDGFAFFGGFDNWGGGDPPWVPQAIPTVEAPNNLAAMLWQDFELFYDAPSNQGVSIANLTSGGVPIAAVIEYDNMEFFGGSPPVLDMEIVIYRNVDPFFPEVIFAYDNVDGAIIDALGPSTVGVENEAGDNATAFANFELVSGVITDGTVVCFDLAGAADPITFTYDVTVDADAVGPTITNEVTSIVTNDPASQPETTSADFTLLNTSPVAVDDSYSVANGETLTVSVVDGVLANDSDPESDPLTAVKTSDPANGTLTLNADGSFTYAHDGSGTGTDSFTYKANDGALDSNEATVEITITAGVPTANDDTYTVDEGGTLDVNGVLDNDVDEEGDPLTAVLVSGPSHGALALDADGSFTYEHNGAESPTDSFTYKASDGTNESDPATVTINVTPQTDPVHNVGLVDGGGQWHLRHADGTQSTIWFGNPGDQPVVGDWDGDGVETPGVLRPGAGGGPSHFYGTNATNGGIAQVDFPLGQAGDVLLAGDWDGDGNDTVGLYRPSQARVMLWNDMSGGGPDVAYTYGNPADMPFAGDFDGDAVETIGLHRPSTGQVFVKNSHGTGVADVKFTYGNPADKMFAGDWTGAGFDTPGIFRDADASFYLKYSHGNGVADETFPMGSAGWWPIAGEMGL